MLLPRLLRPFARPATPITLLAPRFVLPIQTRFLSTTIEQSQSSSSDSTIPPPLDSATPSTQSETQSPSPNPLPYFVGRNNLNSLGVYQQKKRGGNLKVTLVKNGEGDLKALKKDIKEALQLNDGDVSVNSVTRHIVIKGHKRVQVLNFLMTMGF